MKALKFALAGEPVPQGSVTAFVQGGVARVVHKNAKALHEYRTRLADEAANAGAEMLVGPVYVEAQFVFTRPKAHYGTGRNDGVLKASAPLYHSHRPDSDKLARSLLDALTGVCFRDDGQVASMSIEKSYVADGEGPRAEVYVRSLATTEGSSA